MSTYYYLVCDDCKEACHGATSSGKYGGSELIDSDVTLYPFITTHAHHKIRILNEESYYEEITSDEMENDRNLPKSEFYLEWSKDNIEKMVYDTERGTGNDDPDDYNIRIIKGEGV